MKISLFTSTQPRHLALAEALFEVSTELFLVQECKTLFPGKVQGIYPESQAIADYFESVSLAEEKVFGSPRFLPPGIRQLIMQRGDINHLDMKLLEPALHSDYFIVFSGSYLKGPLLEFLVDHRAVNLHAGVSPYFRGASCNFWANQLNRSDLVGSTIHLLSKGLDSGPILFHALPKVAQYDAFELGMRAVEAAHQGLVHHIKNGSLNNLKPIIQDKDAEIKYSRTADFTDDLAAKFLENPTPNLELERQLRNRDARLFIEPYVAH